MNKNKLTSNLGRSLARQINNKNANAIDRLTDKFVLPKLKQFYGTEVWEAMPFKECLDDVSMCVWVALEIISKDKNKKLATAIIKTRAGDDV